MTRVVYLARFWFLTALVFVGGAALTFGLRYVWIEAKRCTDGGGHWEHVNCVTRTVDDTMDVDFGNGVCVTVPIGSHEVTSCDSVCVGARAEY